MDSLSIGSNNIYTYQHSQSPLWAPAHGTRGSQQDGDSFSSVEEVDDPMDLDVIDDPMDLDDITISTSPSNNPQPPAVTPSLPIPVEVDVRTPTFPAYSNPQPQAVTPSSLSIGSNSKQSQSPPWAPAHGTCGSQQDEDSFFADSADDITNHVSTSPPYNPQSAAVTPSPPPSSAVASPESTKAEAPRTTKDQVSPSPVTASCNLPPPAVTLPSSSAPPSPDYGKTLVILDGRNVAHAKYRNRPSGAGILGLYLACEYWKKAAFVDVKIVVPAWFVNPEKNKQWDHYLHCLEPLQRHMHTVKGCDNPGDQADDVEALKLAQEENRRADKNSPSLKPAYIVSNDKFRDHSKLDESGELGEWLNSRGVHGQGTGRISFKFWDDEFRPDKDHPLVKSIEAEKEKSIKASRLKTENEE